MNRPFRNYCFTLNFDSQIGLETALQWTGGEFKESLERNPEFKFAAFQLEAAPETGRIHIQGYLEARKPCRFTWIQGNWEYFNTAHFEPRNGTRDQAIAYCEKEETRIGGPWRVGQDTGQGHRSELDEISTKIRNGKPVLDIASEHPSSFIRYGRGIERLAGLIGPRPRVDWELEVIVYWGEPGSGKTYEAKRKYPGAYEWMPQRGQTIWWNGYRNEETILIDEFANNFQYHYALRLLSEPGIRVETKGGDVILLAKRIIITAMESPEHWWEGIKENRYALYRRITKCYRFSGTHRRGTNTRCLDWFPIQHEGRHDQPTAARFWTNCRNAQITGIEEPERAPENRTAEQTREELAESFFIAITE